MSWPTATAGSLSLEDLADRLAATCVDPQAVADWWEWKAGGRRD